MSIWATITFKAAAGATLVRLEGGSHKLHEVDWDEIIASIVEHTGRLLTRLKAIRRMTVPG
jgi:hypothetical protein